jgi:hypothetical protein
MRQLAIAVLGISLVTASAAQADFGKVKSPTRSLGGTGGPLPASKAPPNYGVPAPKPYKPYTPPAQMKSPTPPGNTDGGKLFKPYKPTSIYGPPTGSKAAKPKSYFDH